jgi:hypothetical protein
MADRHAMESLIETNYHHEELEFRRGSQRPESPDRGESSGHGRPREMGALGMVRSPIRHGR